MGRMNNYLLVHSIGHANFANKQNRSSFAAIDNRRYKHMLIAKLFEERLKPREQDFQTKYDERLEELVGQIPRVRAC